MPQEPRTYATRRQPTLYHGYRLLQPSQQANGAWTCRYYDKKGRLTSRTFVANDKMDAILKLQQWIDAVLIPQDTAVTTDLLVTFKQAADSFIASMSGTANHRQNGTIKSYKTLLYTHMAKYYNAIIPLKSITLLDLETHLDSLKNETTGEPTLTTSTKKLLWTRLKCFFDWCCEHKLLGENPIVKQIKLNGYIVKHYKPFTYDEARLLVMKAVRLKTIVLLALSTGLRKSNILNLKWNQLDFTTHTITIPRQQMKVTNRPHDFVVYMASWLEIYLLSLKNALILANPGINIDKWYVCTGNRPWSGNLNILFDRLLDECQIEHKPFHTCRKYFSNTLARICPDFIRLSLMDKELTNKDSDVPYLEATEKERLDAINRMPPLI